MKTVRYRFWDSEQKKMTYLSRDIPQRESPDRYLVVNDAHITIMYGSNEKDRKGVRIFDKDVLELTKRRWFFKKERFRKEVFYSDGEFYVRNSGGRYPTPIVSIWLKKKVVGNRFESPALIDDLVVEDHSEYDGEESDFKDALCRLKAALLDLYQAIRESITVKKKLKKMLKKWN